MTGESSVNIRNDADAIMLKDQLLSIYPAKEFSVRIKASARHEKK